MPGRTAEAARPGRGTELILLVLAFGISAYAFVQVGLAVTGHLPADLLSTAGIFGALVLIIHLTLRFRAPYADPVILPIAVLLNGIGLAMIYRLDLRYQEIHSDYAGGATRQIMWTMLAITAAVATLLFLKDHRTLRRFTYISMILGLLALLLPLVPLLGQSKQGARIWIFIGPLSFQPAEIAKILLTIFFAGYLVAKRDTLALAGKRFLGLQLPRLRDAAPIFIAWLVSLGVLVLETDLGTSLLFFALFVAMLYIATDRPSWIALGLILASAGIAIAYSTFGHVQDRVAIWLNPLDPTLYDQEFGGSSQLVQGLFGMANGGLFGTGWGQGRPDLTPLAFSDFIIPSLAEELGLVGLIAILLLYLLLAERGFRAALTVRDGFGKLLASGLSFTIIFQVFVVVGGVTRLIPLTGLTTPFMAAGGSSLLANWIIVALLLRISDGARRPAPRTDEIDIAPILQAEAQAESASRERAERANQQMTQVVKKR